MSCHVKPLVNSDRCVPLRRARRSRLRLLLLVLRNWWRIARRAARPLLPIAISRRPAALACQHSCHPRLRIPVKWSYRSVATCMHDEIRSLTPHGFRQLAPAAAMCWVRGRCTTGDCWPVSEVALVSTMTVHAHDCKHHMYKLDEMAQAGLGTHRALGRLDGNDAQLQILHGRHVQVQA